MRSSTTLSVGLIFLFFNLFPQLVAQTHQWEKSYFLTDSLIIKKSYAEADSLCQENLKFVEKKFGKKHVNYARVVFQQATVMQQINKTNESIRLLTDYLPILQKSNIKDSIYHSQILIFLGRSYRKIDSLKNAEFFFLEALANSKERFPEEYSLVLNTLGTFYYAIGRTDEGIACATKAVEFTPKTSPNHVGRLANLGMLYQMKGRFKEALQIAQEACEKTSKSDVNNYFKRLSNLSFLYSQIKLYQKSLDYITQGYEVIKHKKDNPDYYLCLINMSNSYLQLGNFQKAKEFALEAVEVDEKRKALNAQYDFGVALLADCYNNLSQPDKALPLAQEALAQTAKKKGKKSWDYFYSLGVLARIYEKTNQPTKAIACYQEFVDAAKLIWSPTEDRYISTLKNLIPLYNSQNQTDKSTALLKELAESMNTKVVYNLDVLDEISKELFINSFIKDYQPLLFSQIKNLPYKDTSLLKYAYEAELAIKGVVLGSTQLFRQLTIKAQNTVNNEGKNTQSFQEWLSLRDSISKAFSNKASQIHIDSLEQKLVRVEEKLIRLMPEMQQLSRKAVHFEEIRAKLPPDACAIEFVHFRYFNNQYETDTTLYGAMIIRHNKSYPEFIYLCTENALSDFMKTSQTNFNLRRSMASSRGDTKDDKNEPNTPPRKVRERPNRLNALNDTDGEIALYDLIWKPLQAYLDKENLTDNPVQTIYYTPTGLLHRVAFNALSINEKDILSDKYDLFALSSTRKLLTSTTTESLFNQTNSSNAILLYGGILYDSSDTKNTWRYLGGTKKEITDIATLFKKKNLKSETQSGFSASEEHFKSIGTTANAASVTPSPSILHFATHGFFYQNRKADSSASSLFKTATNPLFRSGLIMAGANPFWRGEKMAEGKEDGILTAYEISNMDLSQTRLVVLSACETGLGDIKGTEGVYGLQRAFKMAGVEYILMSLWQVPDEETAELMGKFYTRLLEGDSIESAFEKAQQSMKLEYSAYFWAGFVLMR
jgi:CHAT domain-containing protein